MNIPKNELNRIILQLGNRCENGQNRSITTDYIPVLNYVLYVFVIFKMFRIRCSFNTLSNWR